MKRFLLAATTLVSLLALSSKLNAQKDYTDLVNPFIGTGGHGHTWPGASMPFGMMQLSPDTRLEGWDGCGGYHYTDSKIYGFSHTHLSGTGIPDYCDILFMPFTGAVRWENKEYASPFSHENEKASPGYYEVLLDKHKIRARFTTSYRSGMHEYKFPNGTREGKLLIDLQHRDKVLDAFIEKVNDYEIRGYRRSQSWAQNQLVCFYIRFERPITDLQITGGKQQGKGSLLSDSGEQLKAALTFSLGDNHGFKAKIGISGVSMEGAKMNLDQEITNWDFNELRSKAKKAWNTELGKIDIKGGSKDQQIVFYSALYHTMLSPNIYTDVDGQYRGTDLQVHKAEGFTNYTVFSLWDTYRAFHPLMTILDQNRTRDWIRTFLAQYKYGHMLPVWELSGNETFCMIGYHAVPVIVDAYQKGITGFDTKLAMEAMRSYAEGDRYGLRQYALTGYLSNEKEHESVSKTLEYAYDDWCIAQFAKLTADWDVYKKYIERAQFYKNLFDPSTGHMRGKLQASWYSPFDPREVNNFYTEGNSWHYSFAVPQDIEGLINLMGGREKFVAKVHELFTTSSQLTGRDQSDVTGLIGQYAQGNEPSHHMAYLFAMAGQPWRTEEIVNRICTSFYTNNPDGLIGNEDCGQMSAWFVFSAIGFYPVCPGSGQYVLGSPLFDEVTINLENGNKFVIRSEHGKNEIYIREATLWRTPYTKTFIEHADIMKGGVLELKLDDKPNKFRGKENSELPYSAIRQDLIVAVPFFDMPSMKFKQQTLVKLKSIEPGTRIFYRIIRPNTRSVFVEYKQPFLITGHTRIEAYAQKGNKKSKTVEQLFHRVPDDKLIKVLSEVHPMYTAGGPDALIDGITGTGNWRTGEWQSYFGKDLEAIIDLKKVKPVSYVGIHVLQDVSPWIIYPKELIVETSLDGNTYQPAGRVVNAIQPAQGRPQVQELGLKLKAKTRFVRVRAVNGGLLPPWHESAGNPSHLFIDEIIVR
jgi:predicted alpha-1,2-mannosidase